MPKHDIELAVPAAVVKNKDVEIAVRSDDVLLGRLKLSRGSVDWYPANTVKGRRLSWERFDALMEEHGRKV
ncbi:MAG: hypothetical protein QOI47_1028 [Actinomycetota bacterium]|jgi:hypothetical protein|nr:hypothetical protein [Actinomycetota bacterium]